MTPAETADLDLNRIPAAARAFAKDLFARFPELRRFGAIERADERTSWRLTLRVPAPSGDPGSNLIIWAGGGEEASVAFGGWHTHESVWGAEHGPGGARRALLDLIGGILEDRLAICEDIGGIGDGLGTLVDLSQRDALLEELTSKYSPGRGRLRSWSGRLDRELGLEDLQREPPRPPQVFDCTIRTTWHRAPTLPWLAQLSLPERSYSSALSRLLRRRLSQARHRPLSLA